MLVQGFRACLGVVILEFWGLGHGNAQELNPATASLAHPVIFLKHRGVAGVSPDLTRSTGQKEHLDLQNPSDPVNQT